MAETNGAGRVRFVLTPEQQTAAEERAAAFVAELRKAGSATFTVRAVQPPTFDPFQMTPEEYREACVTHLMDTVLLLGEEMQRLRERIGVLEQERDRREASHG